MREEEQIRREEGEQRRMRGERVVRGVGIMQPAKPCVLCGKQGHLGYQCVKFQGNSGNE